MLASRAAVAGFILALAATLFHFTGFGYDEVRRPFVLFGAALVLAGGAWAARGSSWLHRCSDAALAVIALSGFLAPNSTDAAAALFPAVTAWIFLRATALGWIPRDFLQRHALVCLSAVGVLFSGLGLLQSAGWDAFGFNRGTGLAVSTLGNTNYAGILSAVLALAGVATALFELGLPRRLLGVVAGLAGGLHVAMSGSLAGLLGLGAGGVAFAILLVRRFGWKPVVVFPILILAVAVLPIAGRVSSRVEAIARGEDRTSRIRLGLWKGALRLAADHPILGCGAGSFSATFPPYRDAEERRLTLAGQQGNYFEAEDPHSSYLSVLSESGPVALLAVLSALGLALLAGFRRARDPDRAEARLAFMAFGGLAALAVSGTFNSLPGHLPFAVLAGVLAGLASPVAALEPSTRATRIVTVAAAVLLAVAPVPWFRADLHYRSAMYLTNQAPERILHSRMAVESLPGHWAARYQIAYCWRAIGENEGTVREELREVLRVHPHHVPSMRLLAAGAPPEEEEALLLRAERLVPEDLSLQTQLVGLDRRKRDFASGRRRLERMLEIMPDEPEALYFIGRMWIWEGRPEEAIPWLKRAVAKKEDYRGRIAEDHPELRSDPRFSGLIMK